MIVATTNDDVSFYSNDGQLFSDGEVTIYSPASLPKEVKITSNNLRVCTTRNRNGITVTATDADSGWVFWTEDVPSTFEAGQLSVWLFLQFYAEAR
jgi:hypothetical protein